MFRAFQTSLLSKNQNQQAKRNGSFNNKENDRTDPQKDAQVWDRETAPGHFRPAATEQYKNWQRPVFKILQGSSFMST